MDFPGKDKIFSLLKELLPKNTKILIAFSGGPDSTFLLHLLKNFYATQGWSETHLILAHFNHWQRKESDKELQTILKRYSNHHIYYNPEKPKKWLTEAKLRALRISFFEEVLQTEKITYLATWHNLDDRIETTLLNLIRGSSLRGLINMTFSDKIKKNTTLLRPLLSLKKSTIQSLCDTNAIPYFLDATNDDPFYTMRNNLRNRIIPTITELLPQWSVKWYESRRLIYDQLSNSDPIWSSSNISLVSKLTHPSWSASYCYEIISTHTSFTQNDRAYIFSSLGIRADISQKTLAEWTRFSNTSDDGHKEISSVYFFISHGRMYAIDGKKEFRKTTPSPASNYAKEGDTYKGKRLKKRMINQKIPLFRRNFIQVERKKDKIIRVITPSFT